MAIKEEILKSRIIGFIKEEGNNARITVLGYKDNDGKYIALEKEKIKSVFSPAGNVFAPSFTFYGKKVSIYPDSFIEFSVTENQIATDSSKDKFVVDYNRDEIPITFTPIITINYQTSLEEGFITQYELADCINKYVLEKLGNHEFFLKYKDLLYGLFRYDSVHDEIRSIKGKEVNSYEFDKNYCFNFEDNEYYLGHKDKLPFKQKGVIDCMDDKQLAEWFKELLVTSSEAEKFRNINKEIFQDFAPRFRETDDVIEEVRLYRIKRIKGKLDSLEWTYDEIQKLLNPDSVLMESLKSSLQEMKEEYHAQWAKDIQSEKDKLENEIKSLESKKDNLLKETSDMEEENRKKSEELELALGQRKAELEKDISEKEKSYQTIEKNYNEIIEIIKLQTTFKSNSISEGLEIEPIEFEKVGTPFSKLEEEDGYTFYSLLKRNLELEEIHEKLKEQLNENSPLFTNKACFVPSISWAYLYAKAVRNSKLYTIHVEHDWLHYKDFFNNGLLNILKSCDENKTVNHILMFDSLNLTQPECGLQPLLDVIAGYSVILPVYNKPLPKNLKIFATVVPFDDENKIGLPLDNNNFFAWGRIATREDKIPLPSNFLECEKNIGYFLPENIEVNKIQDNSEVVDNGYFE